MAAGRYSFTILQGSTVDFRIDYRDSNNAPIDLTDYDSRMQIRPSADSNIIICNLTSQVGIDGTGLNMTPTIDGLQYPKSSGSINITISAASSSAFAFDEAHYDLEIYSGSGVTQVVNRILEGRVKLSKEVTRD
jgi:hypothetical protein